MTRKNRGILCLIVQRLSNFACDFHGQVKDTRLLKFNVSFMLRWRWTAARKCTTLALCRLACVTLGSALLILRLCTVDVVLRKCVKVVNGRDILLLVG